MNSNIQGRILLWYGNCDSFPGALYPYLFNFVNFKTDSNPSSSLSQTTLDGVNFREKYKIFLIGYILHQITRSKLLSNGQFVPIIIQAISRGKSQDNKNYMSNFRLLKCYITLGGKLLSARNKDEG